MDSPISRHSPSASSRILWLLRAFPHPLPDVALERMLKDVPPSTVRAIRLRLERSGLIQVAGWSGKGRRKRRTWKVAGN